LDSTARLAFGLFVSLCAGSLVIRAWQSAQATGHLNWPFLLVGIVGWGFLVAALVVAYRPWNLENFTRRMAALLIFFNGWFILELWAERISGPFPSSGSVAQTVIGTLSFQGVGLILIRRFLREHEVGWKEAFGFRNHWVQALCWGVILGCVLRPVGQELQRLSAFLMEHWPAFGLKPEEQQPVQALRAAVTWADRLAMGIATIGFAPVAEEMLFRGILYPAVKQAGFPRLAFWGVSLLFAAIHANLMTLVPLFLLAVFFTLLYDRTGNLLAPIAAHAVFNGYNFLMLYLMGG
jgi:membrane protease YdiL (CAAX protease family)